MRDGEEQEVLTFTQKLSNNVTRCDKPTWMLFADCNKSYIPISFQDPGGASDGLWSDGATTQSRLEELVKYFVLTNWNSFVFINRPHWCESQHFDPKYGTHLGYWHGETDRKVLHFSTKHSNISLVQHYSMDCYFRQYWRDSRLSFKGLKMNSNQLHINQLSLNVKMLGESWGNH